MINVSWVKGHSQVGEGGVQQAGLKRRGMYQKFECCNNWLDTHAASQEHQGWLEWPGQRGRRGSVVAVGEGKWPGGPWEENYSKQHGH